MTTNREAEGADRGRELDCLPMDSVILIGNLHRVSLSTVRSIEIEVRKLLAARTTAPEGQIEDNNAAEAAHQMGYGTASEGRPLSDGGEELRAAAQAVVKRWNSPDWKDGTHTADYIHRLSQALARPTQPAPTGAPTDPAGLSLDDAFACVGHAQFLKMSGQNDMPAFFMGLATRIAETLGDAEAVARFKALALAAPTQPAGEKT